MTFINRSTLALALMFSIALAGLTAVRIARMEREYQPALRDTRQLAATLEATRVLLRDSRLGSADSRLARADSLAKRFHDIAAEPRRGTEQRAQMLGYAASFTDYYVAARRAAERVSMSLDADGSSAEDAVLGYGILRTSFVTGIESQEAAIESSRPATAPVELAAWLALALLFGAALLRQPRRRNAAPAVTVPADDYYVPIPVGDGTSTVNLHDAVQRVARQRLAASVAAARVAKRNNDRQIELAHRWNAPMLSIAPVEQPMAEMDVYVDEPSDVVPTYGRLMLMSV